MQKDEPADLNMNACARSGCLSANGKAQQHLWQGQHENARAKEKLFQLMPANHIKNYMPLWRDA
jgi:hypothetical protein